MSRSAFYAIDRKHLIMLYLIQRRKKKERALRKYWVHPLLINRESAGAFYTLLTKNYAGTKENSLIISGCHRLHSTNCWFVLKTA
jgi:hypothetical protein